jgi:hypothetical protein
MYLNFAERPSVSLNMVLTSQLEIKPDQLLYLQANVPVHLNLSFGSSSDEKVCTILLIATTWPLLCNFLNGLHTSLFTFMTIMHPIHLSPVMHMLPVGGLLTHDGSTMTVHTFCEEQSTTRCGPESGEEVQRLYV